MKTKIDAAKVCQLAGCHMAISNGLINRPIKNMLEKNICTWFLPKISKLDARKKWIISSISPKGDLIIDDGALNALKIGKSLLAPGIKEVRGKFNKGDHVKILDKNMNEFARGNIFGTFVAFWIVVILRAGFNVARIKIESQLTILGAMLIIAIILTNYIYSKSQK